MDEQRIRHIVEAALLAAGRPLAIADLERLFSGDAEAPPRDAIRRALAALAEDCEQRPLALQEVASGFRLQIRSTFEPWVARLWDEKPPRYSRALLETLAIIAYRQPITRSEIEEIRGVSVSTQIMRTLGEREWIRAVILPDDLILGEPCLGEMCAAFDPDRMKCLIAAQEVPRDEVESYGIFDLTDPSTTSPVMEARTLVEKPGSAEAPSTFAAVGRYVLSEDVWPLLAEAGPGADGEIQLTDAIAKLGGLHAFRFSGRRFDCGSKEGWFAATQAYRQSRIDADGPATAAE